MAISYGSSAACYISPTKVAGVTSTLGVGCFQFGANPEVAFRSLLRFSLQAVPASIPITLAELVLKRSGGGTLGMATTFSANRVTQPLWVAGEATWFNYSTGLSWLSQGGDYTVTDASSLVVNSGETENRFDVTDLVLDAIALRDWSLDLLLLSAVETGANRYRLYHSLSAAAEADRPALVLTFADTPATIGRVQLAPSLTGSVRIAPGR